MTTTERHVNGHHPTEAARSLERDRIARAVLKIARAEGINDPTEADRLVAAVIEKMERDEQAETPGGAGGAALAGGGAPAEPSVEEIAAQVVRTSPEARAHSSQTKVRRSGEAAIQGRLPGITDIALAVLEKRYYRRDERGELVEHSPAELFQRVADNLALGDLAFGATSAQVAATADEFYGVMSRLEFLPNSPTLMNAGKDLQQLSACFVLPVGDSMEQIFEAVKHTALIHKSGGGTGFAFSRLRPEGDVVGSTGGVASGPVSFIRAFDTATEVTKQGGTRRGANMGILSVEHPDVLRFISAKEDGRALQNFNISVAVTERFMEAVAAGDAYTLVNPRSHEPAGELNARDVFDKMVELAWKTGDPGIIFIDRMNEPHSNPVPSRGPIESTNPCGEQPLYPYDSCNLGSINLARMIATTSAGAPAVDYAFLGRTVRTAVHLLDNVIEMNRYPLPQIEEMSRAIRRIGLGIMGWADLLIKLDVPYTSEAALELAEQVMGFIQQAADDASAELAEARGVFPEWEQSVYGPGAPLGPRRLRNSTRTTIAPTGTLSMIAGCSSGIEPLFAVSFVRHQADMAMVDVNPDFLEVASREGFYSEELMRRVAVEGTIQHNAEVPDWVKRVFVTSHDITPEWHVRMQAAYQRHTDNAVSKTINFPHEATLDDVRRAYTLAHTEGCKGITIYRDGSKATQVLNLGQAARASDAGTATSVPEVPAAPAHGLVERQRPAVTQGMTRRMRTGHGNMFITINLDEQGHPFEVFTALGKAGGCDNAQLEAISRLTSLALRSGIDAHEIVSHLRGITCCPAWDEGTLVRSAPDALALALDRCLNGNGGHDLAASLAIDTDPAAAPAPSQTALEFAVAVVGMRRCPDCSAALISQEGCLSCLECGFTKCG